MENRDGSVVLVSTHMCSFACVQKMSPHIKSGTGDGLCTALVTRFLTGRGETIHRYIGASRYFVYNTIHRYKYENIDTKRYDFAVKNTRATWRVPREVVNATPVSLVQHTHRAAEQRSWISVIIFTIFQRKRCNVLWRISSLGNVGT